MLILGTVGNEIGIKTRSNKISISNYLGLVSTTFVLSALEVPHYIDMKKTL